MQLPMKTSSLSGKAGAEAIVEEQIRCRAYQLYEDRGREDGHDLEDWIRAEAEISRKIKLQGSAA
jgi:hypothetical protein